MSTFNATIKLFFKTFLLYLGDTMNLAKFAQMLSFSILFSSSFSIFAEDIGNSHHEQMTKEWSGIYRGFIPCVDCKGVKTTLALNKNNSYVLISEYVGKSAREIVEKGKFEWDSHTNTLTLTAKNTAKIRYYAVEQNGLMQLDDKKQYYTGQDLQHYILHHQTVTSSNNEPSHAGH